MDVLELPRPVINFLRTMSKEMNRYSLCWDIYGGSESVTLTLTWKINEQQQQQNLSEKEVQISANGSIDSKKPNIQQQQKQTAFIKNKNMNNAVDHHSRNSGETHEVEIHQRGKSAENISNNNKKLQKSSTLASDHSPIRYQPQTAQQANIVKNDSHLSKIFNGSSTTLSKQQCPPPSLAYIKRKSIEQKSAFIKQQSVKETPQNIYYSTQTSNSSDDPWIKRNNDSQNDKKNENNEEEKNDNDSKMITAVVTKLDSNNNNNNNDNSERKLSLQPSDSYSIPNNLSSNQIKVKFDPTLHYI